MTLGSRPPRRPTRPTRIRVHVEPYDVGALIGLRRATAPATRAKPSTEGNDGHERPTRESSDSE